MNRAFEKNNPDPSGVRPLVVVTGLAGAGHSSALNILEDFGYEAADNLPIFLIEPFVRQDTLLPRPLAVGVDTRTRDFSVARFQEQINSLNSVHGIKTKTLFLECDDDILVRRFTETRRKHPLASGRPVADGISEERKLLSPLVEAADIVIDTSRLSLGQFKQMLEGHFALEKKPGLTLSVLSFSYREGLPREADLVFDARFLKNPHYEESLKTQAGTDSPVQDFITSDPVFSPFIEGLQALLSPLLPRFIEEGKSYLTLAVGCTGGQHRSVFVAETLASWLRERGQQVSLYHRDLRQGDLRKGAARADSHGHQDRLVRP